MAKKIFVYAEQFDGVVDGTVSELVYAVKELQLEKEITVIAFAKKEDAEVQKQISYDATKLLVIDEGMNAFYDEMARAEMVANVIESQKPDYVIIPATDSAKVIFARVAAKLNIGMTADCTELYMDGDVFLQKKPAFGSSAMVVTKEEGACGFVTVVAGAYPQEERGKADSITCVDGADVSQTVALDKIEAYSSKNIQDAEILISLGRGAEKPETVELAEKLADTLGGYVGGTRPLVDSGLIPFEAQVGQTGYTVHPKVCLFFGVSGAIQHTEGVKDTKLTVAVNTDDKAGIFSFADYGCVLDCEEVLKELYALCGGN